MNLNDTIVAPETALGSGALSLFRISGNNLNHLLSDILPLEETEPRRIRKFLLKDLSGRVIDEITFIRYVSPDSYTGEDMIEVFSHGGAANMRRILELFTQRGLRIAEPGEFTFRALLNGKISITKAESIDKICKAENIIELNSALEGLSGRSEKEFVRLYAGFTDLFGELINEVEFSENETDLSRFACQIEEMIRQTEELISSYEKISIFSEGADIVIAGKTNVGKSSLFNRLVGEERSIVT
ncbi:MAG: 50S ribosome-binding GTPase, partial [Deltaproteobacteria bacterium]|nr:50S ribosome-binding GTPase [Deltaproteobacteria bacterium]